jgi:OOP family OmpA-OmpF porin
LVRILGLGFCVAAVSVIPAAEIITAEDFKQQVIKGEQLVRVADNALFLFDSSSSTNAKFRDTGKSRLEVVSELFTTRNEYFPEIGHKFGLYSYTPWKPIYPMQTYNRAKFAEALATLPTKGGGPTTLRQGLEQTAEILKTLKGKTAVFVFTDGGYSRDLVAQRPVKTPGEIAKELVSKYDVCFYVVSTAKEKKNRQIVKAIADLNSCSRLVEFEKFIDRPEYTIGALFEVKATETIITTTETRIVGLEADNVTFEFNKTDIQGNDINEIKEVGSFLKKQPQSYVVVNGYTDNVGTEEYNLGLALRRAESVADYLVKNIGITRDRIVLQWYGAANPVASNNTEQGRASNRRVEMAVGGM